MKPKTTAAENFQPEMYCLVCQHMEWDEEARRCANFDGEKCPLAIRKILESCELTCLVV